MTFVDEVIAVADQAKKVTPAQKNEIAKVYKRDWPMKGYAILDGLTHDVANLPVRRAYSHEDWATPNHFKPHVFHESIGSVAENMRERREPRDIANLLGYAKSAEISMDLDFMKPEHKRVFFELYLACQKALGDIWGYDRVSAGTYKSTRGHVRKFVKSFAAKQPEYTQWALDILHKYEQNPEQLKLDFAI